MEREFTATVYVFDSDKVLLIYHNKHKKWMPPGGHVELNETPPQAAKREALEETGLEIELFKQENVWVDYTNASSFERPYMCLLENIPEHKGRSAHQHMDFIYVGYPIGGALKENLKETSGLRWFTVEELTQINSQEIFPEAIGTIQEILRKFLLPNQLKRLW